MTTSTPISPVKANRLFWLGRYAERVYVSLHLMRRFYDRMIDGKTDIHYEELAARLDSAVNYADKEAFRLGYMYDTGNPASLLSGITAANDNAILLREELMSETISYIQLSLAHLTKASERMEANITALQDVTDYLLAFWGSVEERIQDNTVKDLLRIGRTVEYIDMHVRFDYPAGRISEAFRYLLCKGTEYPSLFNQDSIARLKDISRKLSEEDSLAEEKNEILSCVNSLVTV